MLALPNSPFAKTIISATCVTTCWFAEYFQADEDGDNMDFESLISQLFEVLITLISNRRYQDLMQPIIPDLIYHTIGKHPAQLMLPS